LRAGFEEAVEVQQLVVVVGVRVEVPQYLELGLTVNSLFLNFNHLPY
jgi:hypothetical protein